MKHILAGFFMLLALSIGGAAQNATADWQILAPTGEEFSVAVPGAMTSLVFSDADKKNISRRYTNIIDRTYFFIFSDEAGKPLQFKFALKYAYDHQSAGTPLKINGYEAKKFEFAEEKYFYHTIIFVNGKDHFYVFQTVSPTRDNPLVEQFFASLSLDANSPAVLPSPANNDKSVVVTVPPAVNGVNDPDKRPQNSAIGGGTGNGVGNGVGKGDGRGQGLGLGNGNVQGDGSSNPSPMPPTTPTPSGQTSVTKILSKPRANYTDAARFYEIQGKVVIRVTFLANGAIGATSVMNVLPFGLTEQALIAAKNMKFEPAMKNGVKYSVTKLVEYSFTIY